MLLAKALLFLVLPLALVGAISHEERFENMPPPKSEIVFRIKRLLQMLHERKKDEAEKVQQSRESLSLRSMVERRRRLEEVLRENPGLRALIKNSVRNRKEEEVRMLENDPHNRNCRPGIFFCRTTKSLSQDSGSNEDDKRSETLKKLSKLDDEIFKRGRCRPGIFWCPKSDALTDSDSGNLGNNEKKSLELPETKAKGEVHTSKHDTRQDVVNRLLNFINKDKQDAQRRLRCKSGLCPQGDESNNIEILRMPADSGKKAKDTSSVTEQDAQRRRCRPGLFQCHNSGDESTDDSKGEKLADDLIESLHKTKNAKENDSSRNEKSNYNVDMLAKILESSKR